MAIGILEHKKIEEAILYTLAYFDIFQHPLMLEEIVAFSPIEIREEEVQKVLGEMEKQYKVFQFEGMYALSEQIDSFSTRKKFNKQAAEMVPMAQQYGQLIHRFPFIRAVSISGSLSKGVFKEEDDFDYFIIAAKNRIWLSRLILKAYKILWLKNSRSYFCINYFMSEVDLEIKERNHFTAIELTTLIPVTNLELFLKIQVKNTWVKEFLPNRQWRESQIQLPPKPGWARIVEKLCWGPIGDAGDYAIMQVMKWRNRVKYKSKVKEEDFEHMFKSTRTESKIHPLNMSKWILEKHIEKLSTLEIENI